MEEKIEKQEIGQEIINEWYAEKGISEKEKIRHSEKESGAPDPTFSPSVAKQKQDKKKEEDEKKLMVKKQIRELMVIAETKGLERSIKEARKKNDAFLLDIYHDVVAKDALFKKFLSR